MMQTSGQIQMSLSAILLTMPEGRGGYRDTQHLLATAQIPITTVMAGQPQRPTLHIV